MELVKGVPLTQHCDDRHLTTRQRLELFIDVIAAVQHAHQKGIIHRDLKPSNILVSPHDGKPVVKVIDFGIAKALGSELTERTIFTGVGRLIGTPEYMSPEQAALKAMGCPNSRLPPHRWWQESSLRKPPPSRIEPGSGAAFTESRGRQSLRRPDSRLAGPRVSRLTRECPANEPAAAQPISHLLRPFIFSSFSLPR